MKRTALIIAVIVASCTASPEKNEPFVNGQTVDAVVAELTATAPDKALMERGVRQTASLWQAHDGSQNGFANFCRKHFIADTAVKRRTFLKISDYMEAMNGRFNEMILAFQRQVSEDTGPLLPVDEMFAAYNPATHSSDDLYANKLAFVISLNFPKYSLNEKEKCGNDRLRWAYSRMGDMFTSRVPAELQQAVSAANSDAELYISAYNIYAGNLLNRNGEKHFPAEMILLAHWNLRDEIKANYSKTDGADKQRTIYEVMKHIVAQDIPKEVINSKDYDWNPFTNKLFLDGKEVVGTPENNVRYEKLLACFHTLRALDEYTGHTVIERSFDDGLEISSAEAEKLFRDYLSAPELKELGKVVAERLHRPLEAQDLWYDGFKLRSALDEDKLSAQTRRLYPDAEAMQHALPTILTKLGFAPDRAAWIADKIEVDAARGSGHAWGAAMRGQKSHLRTRIPATGMDYKGYNIAIHEFGHNVEQTLSLYDIDYYMLSGVPNTAFTEALAFVFQKRDLKLLGIDTDNADAARMDIFDRAWQLYEMCGVSLLDIEMWKWLYAHPDATAAQLNDAVASLAREIWNQYYAPVYGVKDETILAVYSHMVLYPLYLSAYAYGQIIEYQLEQQLSGRDFAAEVDRIFRQGRLTPNQWMLQATGKSITTDGLLKALRKGLTENKK